MSGSSSGSPILWERTSNSGGFWTSGTYLGLVSTEKVRASNSGSGLAAKCLRNVVFFLCTWRHLWQSVQFGEFLPSRVWLSKVGHVRWVTRVTFVIPWGLVFCLLPVIPVPCGFFLVSEQRLVLGALQPGFGSNRLTNNNKNQQLPETKLFLT